MNKQREKDEIKGRLKGKSKEEEQTMKVENATKINERRKGKS